MTAKIHGELSVQSQPAFSLFFGVYQLLLCTLFGTRWGLLLYIPLLNYNSIR